MIPMSELIKDPDYRRFMTTMPATPVVSRDKEKQTSPPWVVYIQKEVDGRWYKREFWRYKKAFKFFKQWLPKCHDITINNKRVPTDPPSRFVRIRGKYVTDSKGVRRQATKRVMWQLPAALAMDQADHQWCRYCRRPVVFKYYSKHRRLGVVDSTVPRCCICGASSRIAAVGRVHN